MKPVYFVNNYIILGTGLDFRVLVWCVAFDNNVLVWKLFWFYYVVIYATLIAYCYLNVNYFLYEANIYIYVMLYNDIEGAG